MKQPWFTTFARKGTVVAIMVVIALHLSAQVSPNIIVTDSERGVHDLYTDYLDKGKTVLIGIFYSTCPPCRRMAPDLQMLYDDWGSGQSDVEFIKISRQTWETDQTARQYKDKYGLTFPVVSNEGGSVEAFKLLLEADLGQFYSTPLYLVVAPDGTVQWDVYGIGTEGTIKALDDALAATGAQKTGTTSTGAVRAEEIEMFPNPARGVVHISTVEGFTTPTVKIFTVEGRLIRTLQPAADDMGYISFDITDLSPGLFTIIVEEAEHKKSGIFIKY